MAALAMVAASSEIYGCTQTGTINDGPVHYIKYAKRFVHYSLFMDHAVMKFGKFGVIPSVGRANEIACNAL